VRLLNGLSITCAWAKNMTLDKFRRRLVEVLQFWGEAVAAERVLRLPGAMAAIDRPTLSKEERV
jgi:hypothetical protein